MAFVSPDLAQSTTPVSKEATDATVLTEANLNDNDTGTTATAECRLDMTSYKFTHDLGFAVANIDSMSVRIFDGAVMTAADVDIYPYSSGDTDVVTGNQVTLAILDNGAYDTAVMTAAFISDLEDVGTNQISVRIASAGFRGRANEIQLEFAEAAAGAILDPIMGPGIIPFER